MESRNINQNMIYKYIIPGQSKFGIAGLRACTSIAIKMSDRLLNMNAQ